MSLYADSLEISDKTMKSIISRIKTALSSLKPGAMIPPVPEHSREDSVQFVVSDILRGLEESEIAKRVRRYQLTLDDIVAVDLPKSNRFYQTFARQLSFKPNLHEAIAYLTIEYGKVSEKDIIKHFDFIMEYCLPSLQYSSNKKFWLKSLIRKNPYLIPQSYRQYNYFNYPDWLFLSDRGAISEPIYTRLAYCKERSVNLSSPDMFINLLTSADLRPEHEDAFCALMCLTDIDPYKSATVYFSSISKYARHPVIASLLLESVMLQRDGMIRFKNSTHHDQTGMTVPDFALSLCAELLSVKEDRVSVYHFVATDKVTKVLNETAFSSSDFLDADHHTLFLTLGHLINMSDALLNTASCITDTKYHTDIREVIRSGIASMAEIALPDLSEDIKKTIAKDKPYLVQAALSDAGFPIHLLPDLLGHDRRKRMTKDLGI